MEKLIKVDTKQVEVTKRQELLDKMLSTLKNVELLGWTELGRS